MQIGINFWTLPNGTQLREGFRMAKAAGFDTVEINMAEEGEVNLHLTETSARAISAAASEEGVVLSSLSTGLGWKYPLSAADEETRTKGMDVVRKMLQTASWIGMDTILLVPATVTADVAYDEAYERALNGLKILAPYAASMGVSIGVENVWNRFLLSPLEFARFIDEADSPMVGAYFDAGNVLAYGYPDQWVRILGKRIKKVHVKDFRGGLGNGVFCNPLQGDVPWERVRKELDAIGYNGPITAEVEGYRVHKELGLKHIAESLRSVFGS